jgi:hypothetical protein
MRCRYFPLMVMLAPALLLASCGGGGDGSHYQLSVNTGTVSTNLVWDLRASAESGPASSSGTALQTGMPTVVYAEISAEDIPDPITELFSFKAGQGTLRGVPAGSRRRLLVRGLTDDGEITHQGVNENLTVVANTVNRGTILLPEAILRAVAGPDITVEVGSLVELDGTQSQVPQGDTIFFNWHFVSVPQGSAAIIENPASPRVRFLTDVPGDYEVELTVYNQLGRSHSDGVRVTALAPPPPPPVNRPPVAAISASATSVLVGQRVVLDGTGSSDPDGDPLTYMWSLQRPPQSAAQLENRNQPITALTPDIPGQYLVQLIVDDGVAAPSASMGRISSQPAQVIITALAPPAPNRRPVADAGAGYAVPIGTRASLNGTASYDPDGDALLYQWSLALGPVPVTIEEPTAAFTYVTLPAAGTYIFSLVVSDGQLVSLPAQVPIDVYEPVAPPLPGPPPPPPAP